MDVFISYRREGALDFAGRMYEKFTSLGYSAFYDIESMNAGKFNEQIYKKIERCKNFVLVLPKNGLDRCDDPEDWVRKEIRHALENKKNIVPVLLSGFKFPDKLPDDITQVKDYQGVNHSSAFFKDTFEKVLDLLIDENGESLAESHKKNKSNTYYGSVGMTEDELNRIRQDYTICRDIEVKIFDEFLQGKKNLTVFNPAIYEIDTTMQKYNREEIGKVFGFLCNQPTADKANEKYSDGGKNKFYSGDLEDKDFADKMDFVLTENRLTGFDLVDLTLILKDAENPFKKLQQIVERLNPGAVIYIRELNDSLVQAYPDENNLIAQALELMKVDLYAGGRDMGRRIYTYLNRVGATKTVMHNRLLTTAGMNARKRKLLFDTYFSYLAPEIDVLLSQDPESETLLNAKRWLSANYDTMEEMFLSRDFLFVSGFMFYYAIFDDV